MTLDASLLARAVPPGSMRYYAWLFTPAEQRDVLAAIFLLELELRDSARAPHEVAHVRLQWWREEFDRLSAGKAQHPATQLLQQAASTNTDFKLLQRAHLSAAQELANATYETDVELSQYLQGGLGSLFAVATQLMNQNCTAPMLDAAMQLGAFVRHAEILRDLRSDFHHGRLSLPLSLLDAQQVEYEQLQQPEWPTPFTALLSERIQQQLQAFHSLQQGLLNTEKQALRPLLVLAQLHARLLSTLATDPVVHTQQRLELTPLQKLWTAWRAARKAR